MVPDCKTLFERGVKTSGVYPINPDVTDFISGIISILIIMMSIVNMGFAII